MWMHEVYDRTVNRTWGLFPTWRQAWEKTQEMQAKYPYHDIWVTGRWVEA